jgi:O-antigen biosynthesis protein
VESKGMTIDLNYQIFYDEKYYANMVPGIPYDRVANGGHWLRFFNAIADRLFNYLAPQSVLDVGCAKGFLIEAFSNRGVATYGFDYSDFAISSVREDFRPFVFTANAADNSAFNKFQDDYDLITCIEVVEHMPRQEAVKAIQNMCQHSQAIFFSSTADDFSEPTHLTVLPRIEWLKIFLKHNFCPDYSFDIYDLIPHGILLRKIEDPTLSIQKLIEYYELNFDYLKTSQSKITKLNSEIINLEAKLELEQSELERSQLQLQQTQAQLEVSQLQLQQTQVELEHLQVQLKQTQAQLEVELKRSQSQLQQTQAELVIELQRSQSQSRQTQSELQEKLESLESQLQATQLELVRSQSHAAWMETSKFWKLRLIFMTFKQKLGAFSQFPLVKLAIKSSIVIRKEGYKIFSNRTINFLKHRMMGVQTKSDFADAIVAEVLRNFAEPPEYGQYIKDYEPTKAELEKQKQQALLFNYLPVLSIILPVYKLPLSVLQETINSVFEQTYPNWELCIAYANIDDSATIDYLKAISSEDNRIKLNIMPENLGISGNSNASLEMATGEFVILLDHDDLLALSAFYEIVSELNKQPDLDFIYSDKDCISANSLVRSRLLLKPNWSPEILYSANYLTHLCIVRRELIEKIGGFRPETDGAQDWDIFLRITEQTSKIARISSILYHWRIIQGSTSLGIDSKPYALEAQLRSIQNHLSRMQLPVTVSPHSECGFRLKWKIPSPRVSIIIDGDVSWEALSTCIHAVAEFADPQLHKIKVVRLQASEQAIQRETLTKNVKVPIDWLLTNSQNTKLATLNEAATQDTADVILFVSGQVIRFQPEWIQELSGWVLGHPEIGFASAVVLTNNNIVVEAGLVVDKNGNGSPLLRGRNLFSWEIFGGALWYRNCTASSPWAIAFSSEHYKSLGGLPIDSPSIQHSIIKLCQASNATNKRGLSNPHARAYLGDIPKNDVPKFDDSLADDPYFHHAFASVVPLKLKAKK